MSASAYTLDDTIAAAASPPGPSAEGIVRISGTHAFDVVETLAADQSGHYVSGSTASVTHCAIYPSLNWPAIPAVVYRFAGPRSYTGQDCAEVHVPGSPAVLDAIVQTCCSNGCRTALPGEFTARAFLNGKLDLTEAEGVAAIINAGTDSQLRAAERLLSGTLARIVRQAADALIDLLATVEAGIDFVEEDIELASADSLLHALTCVRTDLQHLQDTAQPAERLNAVARVVLTGPVNAGKSTLMNALTQMDRAICSPVHHATRDILTAPWRVDNHDCMLIDCPGLTPLDSTASQLVGRDAVLARAAMERAHDQLAQADVILYVCDAGQMANSDSLPVLPHGCSAVVYNKTDVLPPDQQRALPDKWPPGIAGSGCGHNGPHDNDPNPRAERIYSTAATPPESLPCIAVSALDGSGLDAIYTHVARHLQRMPEVSSAPALAIRHRQDLADTLAACARAEDILRRSKGSIDEPELLAAELRDALTALTDISGRFSDEQVLGRIFGQFCIGK